MTESFISEIANRIKKAENIFQLDQLKAHYLGKKGVLTEQLKNIVHLAPEEKKITGQLINKTKQEAQVLFQEAYQQLAQKEVDLALAQETIDVSLPARTQNFGSLHPITQTRQHIEDFFIRMGFQIVEGPEIEDDFHNFSALNIPQDHPARAMHDTFYLEPNAEWTQDLLLRTHTSSVQIRTMENQKPPIRVITPGRVYRCDSDLTHTPMFHQLEGLLIDEHCSFSDLKGLLRAFMRDFFGQENLNMRFRPSYFPFTEPSAEVDIQCVRCQGKGCRVCKKTGWLEILGCGMVHPKVLEAVNINSEIYTAYAFGVGMDRLTMLRYNLPDLRMLFENNEYFLEQFS